MEAIKKLGWFHFFILKALVSGGALTTREMGQRLDGLFKFHGISYSSECRRVIFMQKIQLLIDLGIVEKTRGAVNTYWIKKGQTNNALMLCGGFFRMVEEGKGGN